jgi:UDP-glucuronate 4-epimerase
LIRGLTLVYSGGWLHKHRFSDTTTRMTDHDLRLLVTGAAGFIGFHLASRAGAAGFRVVGLDSINDYYDPRLKEARLAVLSKNPGFAFRQVDLADREAVDAVFDDVRPTHVVNLAAQAGVQYSKVNPYAYGHSNLTGFLNVLEACRRHEVRHLVYASSSSVYGANTTMPFSVHQSVDHPLSLYAATKKANEMMAHAYSNTYGLATTGLRFFTVYGPWGRPDMAMWIFSKAILAGDPITLFNNGKMRRDFTYVDDIVEGIFRLIPKPAAADPSWSGVRPDPATSQVPYRLYNIGNNNPVELEHLISVLEHHLGREAIRNYAPLQVGDVPETYADVDDLARGVGFSPSTSIEDGVGRFVHWYRDYHGV